MEAILYAEIYLICLLVNVILIIWAQRKGGSSAAENWMKNLLMSFILNFASNFLFTLFNSIIAPGDLILSYIFKTMYHLSLITGVLTWSIYAEVDSRNIVNPGSMHFEYFLYAAFPAYLIVLINLFTGHLFHFSETGAYIRDFMFQAEMGYLLIVSSVISLRVINKALRESDPSRKSHLMLISSFPLCIAAAWILSFTGESFPVICVSIMVELLLIFMGTTFSQISLDKLTQVNNRQNLMGYLNYKMKASSDSLVLMIMDIDHFKSINDSYGHLEGDNALIQFSSALKTACGQYIPRPYIARYGGDEFIVAFEGSDEDVEILMGDIRHRVEEKNSRLPYELTVSIGKARKNDDMRAAGELIAEADRDLYSIKNSR